MTILITGVLGFIGKHLVDKLQKLNHKVLVADLSNNIDISKIESLNIFEKEDIDVIYHLAGQSFGRKGEENPYIDKEWNIDSTLNVNLFAKKKNISKIIYTSTMAIYGNNLNASETDLPNPISNYGVSKLFGEYSIKKYSSECDFKYTIFRLWNTYGPGNDLNNPHKGIVQAMCNQALNSTNINVTGSLDRYRDLIHINDVVDALILGLDPKTDNETYNLSTGKKTTIKSLISTIIDILNNDKKYKINNIGKHKGDQFGCVGDSSKLQSLGWKPNMDIRKGLETFLNYIQNA